MGTDLGLDLQSCLCMCQCYARSANITRDLPSLCEICRYREIRQLRDVLRVEGKEKEENGEQWFDTFSVFTFTNTRCSLVSFHLSYVFYQPPLYPDCTYEQNLDYKKTQWFPGIGICPRRVKELLFSAIRHCTGSAMF